MGNTRGPVVWEAGRPGLDTDSTDQECVAKRAIMAHSFIASPRRHSRGTTPQPLRYRPAARFGQPSGLPQNRDIQQFAWCSIRFCCVPACFGGVAHRCGDHIGDLCNSVVDAGAHVDVAFGPSKCSRRYRHALAKSSTCSSSRRGVPVPQFVTSGAPLALASSYLRMSAGSRCELDAEKLSPGPYRLVGIAEIHARPYWRLTAWTCRMPAILAIAYALFVGSRGPVSSALSSMGCAAYFG